MRSDFRVALVQDAIPFVGGAERVLEAVLEIFPNAPIYTLVFNSKALEQTIFANQEIHTSFINRLPGSHARHRLYMPLYPIAVEQFDLRSYDMILSFNYAVAHGILPRPDQLHISLTYTPLRYAWHFYQQYLHASGLASGPRSWGIRLLLHYLRLWDQAAAQRVDTFVAISDWVRQCVWRAYRRPAQVIYPPVDLQKFHPAHPREDFYLAISRFAPHKRVDIIVQAFSKMGLPLRIIGEGKDFKRLQREAAANVTFLGHQPDSTLQDLLSKAKGLVHAAEEDFGIALVEAQAAGCPVIAYGKGGALETVIPNKTGVFFNQQTVESLIVAVNQFEAIDQHIDIVALQENAARFSKARFQQEYHHLVSSEWENFVAQGGKNRGD
jgi:glycosyltransferase involved in cell wall biosynthesis